ncbi:MAG: glycosyltransferase, partial [Porticoccaceae bacterium]|nr:glycosyltransferase [Porticoccaceae bacterium]
KFQHNFDQVKNSFRNEQAYLSDEVNQRGELSFWPPEWCVSFKYDCVAPWPLGYFQTPSAPAGSKILIFHGHPLPDEAIDGVTHKWYRPIRPCPWLKEYWK